MTKEERPLPRIKRGDALLAAAVFLAVTRKRKY
jgi:hypothetical protein